MAFLLDSQVILYIFKSQLYSSNGLGKNRIYLVIFGLMVGHFKEELGLGLTGKNSEKYYKTKLKVLLEMLYIDQWKRCFVFF
jgi:hypothetical protein